MLAEIGRHEALLASDSARKAELEAQARSHRRSARRAKRDSAATRYELRKHAPLIRATIGVALNPEHRAMLKEDLVKGEQAGWNDLMAAIRAILDGQRDPDLLCDTLDLEDSMIVEAILSGLNDPSAVSDEQRVPE